MRSQASQPSQRRAVARQQYRSRSPWAAVLLGVTRWFLLALRGLLLVVLIAGLCALLAGALIWLFWKYDPGSLLPGLGSGDFWGSSGTLPTLAAGIVAALIGAVGATLGTYFVSHRIANELARSQEAFAKEQSDRSFLSRRAELASDTLMQYAQQFYESNRALRAELKGFLNSTKEASDQEDDPLRYLSEARSVSDRASREVESVLTLFDYPEPDRRLRCPNLKAFADRSAHFQSQWEKDESYGERTKIAVAVLQVLKEAYPPGRDEMSDWAGKFREWARAALMQDMAQMADSRNPARMQ